MIEEHEVEIDGEARDVPEEQVDRRAALQGELPAPEDNGCHFNQKPGGGDLRRGSCLEHQQAFFRTTDPSLWAPSWQSRRVELEHPGEVEFPAEREAEPDGFDLLGIEPAVPAGPRPAGLSSIREVPARPEATAGRRRR